MNPSNANRRVQCPGSRALEELYPIKQESPAVREGKAAHWVALQLLKSNFNMGSTAPNGEPITKDMLDGAELYCDSINEYRINSKAVLNIETPIDISNIIPWMKGTPDAFLFDDMHLIIWD